MPYCSPSPNYRILVAAICLLVGAALKSVHSADAPAAKLVIQSAKYGDLDNDKTVDVTQKIVGMIKDDYVDVLVSKENFGDPAPGAEKKLRVGYTIDGVYFSKTVAAGEIFDISAKLIIRKAVYGDLPTGPTADVTDDVAATVRKNKLSVAATNDAFGDPASGVPKKLRVDYTFDGKDKSKTVAELCQLACHLPREYANQPNGVTCGGIFRTLSVQRARGHCRVRRAGAGGGRNAGGTRYSLLRHRTQSENGRPLFAYRHPYDRRGCSSRRNAPPGGHRAGDAVCRGDSQ
jgi:hypothetical protein